MRRRIESPERLAYEAHKAAREQVLESLTKKLHLGLDAIGQVPTLEEVQQTVVAKVGKTHDGVGLNHEQSQNIAKLDGQLKDTVVLLQNHFETLTEEARREQERVEKEQAAKERIRLEQERRSEEERIEKERVAKEQHAKVEPKVAPKVDLEQQRLLEQQRIEQENAKKERARLEQERVKEQQRAEQERKAKLEQQRILREQQRLELEQDRLAHVEQERLAKSKQSPKVEPKVDPLSRATQEQLSREARQRVTGTSSSPKVKVEVLTEETEEQLQRAYQNARGTLSSYATSPKVKAKIEDMLAQVDKLYNAGHSCKDLTTAMNETLALLDSDQEQERFDAYNAVANKMQGHASLGWKILGILMMAIGAAVAAFGIATGLTGVDLGLTSAGGASLFAAGSLTFYKGTQGGLSKAMSNVGVALTAEEEEDSTATLTAK